MNMFKASIYSYVDVAPLLAAKGYRVIVPYLRGSDLLLRLELLQKSFRQANDFGCLFIQKCPASRICTSAPGTSFR